MRKTFTSVIGGAIFAISGLGTAQAAPFATIDIFTFDLGQFSDAFVTTDGVFFSSQFDNAAGVDGFELGELAARPGGTTFPTDTGDRISLGETSGAQNFLTLDYGANPFAVGAGQASNFVVYESSGRDGFVDPEGLNFEISFNGGSFVSATSASTSSNIDVDGAGGAASHNQIVFDLTNAAFGFTSGDLISTVGLRNLVGTDGTFDPDFTFAARAGVDAAVPLPATLPLMALALLGLGAVGRRRAKIQ